MPIRKLLLPLTGTAAGEASLVTALMVARKWDAHLRTLHVRVDARDVAPLAGEGLSGAMIEEMMAATEKESGERAVAVKELFDRVVTREGVRIVDEVQQGLSASFRLLTGREEDLFAQRARLADLSVIPHPEAPDEVSSSDALHAVLFDSGRPILICPISAPVTIGTRIAVAWNGTAESAAAVQAALPWMEKANAVRVLASDEYQRRGPVVQDLIPYIALHGVTAEVATFRSVDKEVGAGLLAAAREFGADLLVMGAYSHSRLRQLILGGVTRHVLENAHLPVMMCR